MRLLLDTHIALWAIADSPRLPAEARRLIMAPENEIAVSAASVREIAIKHGTAKKNMPVSGAEAKAWFAQQPDQQSGLINTRTARASSRP